MKHIFQKTHNKMVTIFVGFDGGARAEGTKYSPGIAHMLEHMLFKGTEKRHYLEIPKQVAFLGGDINAFTSHEMVAYYIRVPYEKFEEGAEILSDIVLNSTLPEDEFQKEREVVYEECLSYKDSVTYDLLDAFEKGFYTGRLATDVIGTEESIKGFTHDELCEFYKEFYNSENGILAISGDLDEDQVREVSEKYFGAETEFSRNTGPEDISNLLANSQTVFKKDIEQSYVYIVYPGLAKGDPDNVTMMVLQQILGSGMDSRLFTEVREKNNLCYGIGMGSHSNLEIGATMISSSTRPDNIEKMLELIDVEIGKIREEEALEEELQRAKNKLRSSLYSIYDSGDAVAKDTLRRVFFDLPPLSEVSERLEKVTAAEVLALAQKLFVDDYKHVYILKGE